MAPNRLDSPVSNSLAAHASNKADDLKPAADDLYGSYCPADLTTLSLESNFGPMDADNIGYLQPTSVNTSLEMMRDRFERDGYLFVC